jgi:hypothetical protein
MPNYGSNGYGGYPVRQPEMPMMNEGYQGQNGGPPPVPQKQSQLPPRAPMNLGAAAGSAPITNGGARPGAGEKRKSWFAKRFSKS